MDLHSMLKIKGTNGTLTLDVQSIWYGIIQVYHLKKRKRRQFTYGGNASATIDGKVVISLDNRKTKT